MQSSRLSIRVCIMCIALLVGCTQPTRPTPILTVSPSAIPSPTFTASGSPSPIHSPTATASPTLTLTSGPTLTPWQINLFYPITAQLVLDPNNPHQLCMITYFDLTPAAGFLGVWRRDNGGYLICEAQIAPERSQP